MRRLHRLLAPCLATGLLLAAAASAQEFQKLAGTTPAQRAAVQTEFMRTRLGLNETQQPKIAALNLKYAEQMQPILQGSDGPLMKMAAARRVDEAKDEELRGVLTPGQFQKYLAAKDELRQHLEQKLIERRQGGSGTP